MNHQKRSANDRIKKSREKYKKQPKHKKVNIEKIIKGKTYRVGKTQDELRLQFSNFSTRYINLAIASYKTVNKKKAIQQIIDNTKTEYNGAFVYHGLSIPQMQHRVRKLKQMLDTLRLKRKTLYYSNK